MGPWSKFREIKAALDSEDIEGLLALGCPSDEYDGEASLIESGMARATSFGETPISAKELQEIVAFVWNDRFGPFSLEDVRRRSPAFAAVAEKLTR
ncbi:MAG TPA: hypothetical protein VMD76_06175 [Candidatus Sulfotelmatobacter sp.]|nr:hypothetical protein [Candidatus Sulfotelmatobacter sp.]